MENPDVVLELIRNEEGSVIQLAYKVHTREDESRSAAEFCGLAKAMLEAEGHELIGVRISADVLGSVGLGKSEIEETSKEG